MRPIKDFLSGITDRYLFQKRYSYKELLKTFTAEVLTVLELDKLTKLTAEKLREIIRLESCEIVLSSEKSIKAKEGGLVVPLVLKDRRIGSLVLGKKKSDESYTQDDMDILLPLARTLAIAISNAELFSELSKAQANAAQKEKMAGIGTLAAGMAHEIRNPITTIKIFTEYLDEKKNDPEFMAKFERLVPKEVDKINHMITSLLEFSKPAEGGEGEKVDINSALAEVAGILGNEMVLNDIVFDNKILNTPQVLGNKKHIQEILFNIIENAIHAIGRRGKISVTAESGRPFVTVSIEDNGQGIPEENLKNIFEPFFTTKMNQKGVGLGLYVIKQLMTRMDGSIEVESKVAKGTVFRLRFRSAS
jgi:polar amino acid transport system substrate-binding protein